MLFYSDNFLLSLLPRVKSIYSRVAFFEKFKFKFPLETQFEGIFNSLKPISIFELFSWFRTKKGNKTNFYG